MAVDEAHGGWGASMLDLALLAELQGRHVAPAPVIETQVAARLLATLDTPAANAALDAALGGERIVTIAVRPAVTGGSGSVAQLVPAGAAADDAVVLVDDRLLLVPLAGRRTVVENLGTMPVADLALDDALDGAVERGDDAAAAEPRPVVELATGAAALAAHDAAVTDWMALTGACLVGLGARALEIGVEYVKERHAWGVPIATFQSIAHRLADSATAIDGARLLAYEAAWAFDEQPERAAELAAMCFAFAYEAARDVTYRSLHYHGGYGFMMEYDIQLYYRRARAWANVLMEPELAYRRVADQRYSSTSGTEAG
jgi:hypothetical protein